MSQGTTFRAPFSVKLSTGALVTIVDANGVITGAITPSSFGSDTLFTAASKLEFRAAANYINSPATGKIAIVGSGGGADDVTLSGGITLSGAVVATSTLALTGAATLSSTLAVSGATTLGVLTVSGALTLSSTVAAADNITLATSKKLILRSSGIYINSPSAGKLVITADGGGADDITLTGGITVTGAMAITGAVAVTGAISATTTIIATVGVQAAAVARTATAGGGTTGTIAANTSVVAVTCDTNTKAITLPTPTPGVQILLLPASTAYKLQTSSPTTVAINGGTGAGATSTVAAGSTAIARCTSATTWVVKLIAADGTETAAAAAA